MKGKTKAFILMTLILMIGFGTLTYLFNNLWLLLGFCFVWATAGIIIDEMENDNDKGFKEKK